MISDLAVAILTLLGGGGLLKISLNRLGRKTNLKNPSPPTMAASSNPTIRNQRTRRTGRLCVLSAIGLPARLGSVTIFMSCTFCSYRLSRIRLQLAAQMRSNCGLGKSDAAQDELRELLLQIGGVAVGKTGHRRKPRQRRHQNGVVREPEQVERIVADPCRVPGSDRAFDRRGEHRPDQAADLVVEQPRE